MEASTMSENFHDWLNECPCHWVRLSNKDNNAEYSFTELEE